MKNVALLSSSYSGSTLLSMLVCSHPNVIGFGDTYNYQFLHPDDTRCTCGARPSRTCPVRIEIENKMRTSGADFNWITSNPTPIFDVLRTNRSAVILSRKAAWVPVFRALPDSARLRLLSDYYHENKSFMAALAKTGDYSHYFDGCKTLLRLELLRTIFPETKVVHLIKNPNAYLHSFLKRKKRRDHGIVNGWFRYNASAHDYREILGPENYLLVTFEELTKKPEQLLQEIYRFMGLPEREGSVEQWMDMAKIHVIGSETKNVFRQVDEKAPKWKTDLNAGQLAYIKKRVAETRWLHPIFPDMDAIQPH
ncbi:hypothetical protein CCR95_09205 [Thiocystis minor]|uniref:sulfotransferase n=1 Tax=Thiocystis minor TaxID=61597 RepID=UPI0019126B37|nr:sulfotransferase [Thiocystis minor]MBK5964259.1 hypothetical protein [Thiocystis minor]